MWSFLAVRQHLGRGQKLLDSGDFEKAIDSFQEAIRIKPTSAKAHVKLGTAMENKGDLDGAVAAHRKAIELKPGFALAYSGLGSVLEKKDDLDGAIAAYREGLARKPGNIELRYDLGFALLKNQEVEPGAQELVEAACRRTGLSGTDGKLFCIQVLRNSLLEQGYVDAAVAICREALRLDPGSGPAHANLGAVLLIKYDLAAAESSLDEAITLLREAIRIEPNLAAAHDQLGVALGSKGDLDGEIASHREAIRLAPEDADNHWNLALSLAKTGDAGGTAASLRRAIELEPAKLGSDVLGMLFERRLVTDALPDRLFISHDESVTLSVGAIDHLKIAARVAGDGIEDALRRVRSIDRILEPHLNYAVSLDLGYLSAEITNLGTGLRTSVLLHLPALSASDRLEELAQSIAKSDFALVPDEELNDSGDEPVFFQLSNVRTLGLEEDAIANKLEDHTRALVHYERVARAEIVASQKEHLTDVSYRSLGILRNARLLTADETLRLLSRLRFGIVANLVSGVAVETVTALLFLTRDRHVRFAVQEKARSVDHGEENLQTTRALRVRSALVV